MQRELGVLDVQYYSDPVKAMQQQLTRSDINDKTAKIDAKKKEIEADQQAIDDAAGRTSQSGRRSRLGSLEHYAMEPVLLVEDKAELRAMLRKALERAGYTVEEAPDGNAAIDKVRARRYLLVLSDLKLPGNSGIEVLREALRVDPTLPFIIMTAYGSVEEAVTAMKEGAFDFIQKPVDLDHLRLLLERAAQAAGTAARKSAAARGIRRALRLPTHRRRSSRDERSQPDDAAGGRHGLHRAAAGRERHRQRAFRARHSSPEPARRAAVRGAQLRGHSRRLGRK